MGGVRSGTVRKVEIRSWLVGKALSYRPFNLAILFISNRSFSAIEKYKRTDLLR